MRISSIFHGLIIVISTFNAAAAGEALNWVQFYSGLGLSAGKQIASPEGDNVIVETGGYAPELFKYKDVAGVVIVGASARAGRAFLGLEADLEMGRAVLGNGDYYVRNPDGGDPVYCYDRPVPCIYGTVDGYFDTIGHIRALAGYEITPSVEIFASAGVALADATILGMSQELALPNVIAQAWPLYDTPVTQRLLGASVGLGLQVRLTDLVALRTEVIHDSYPDIAVPDGGSSVGAIVEDKEIVVSLFPEVIAVGRTAARASVIVGF
jgi:hypothetical protein